MGMGLVRAAERKELLGHVSMSNRAGVTIDTASRQDVARAGTRDFTIR